MYSVTMGLVHPRINDKSSRQYTYFDISENFADLHIVKNLMKEVLNTKNSVNIIDVFEDFFKERCIDNSSNIYYQRILSMFVEYHKWYMGYKKSAFNFYLVKRDLEKDTVLDIINVWKTCREVE